MTSAVPRHRYTFREYLDLQEIAGVRLEYLDGEIYAMAGGSAAHSAICARLLARLVALTDGGPCEAHTPDFVVRVRATGLATYPDASVVCGAIEPDPDSPNHCANPAILFEILSPGTESYDRGEKREHYQQIESLRDYIVLAQDRVHAEHWTRNNGVGWTHQEIGPDGVIRLAVIGGSITLGELYRRAIV